MNTSINPSELLAHLDWVQRLAQQLVQSPEEAQDLAQDTWLAALSRPPKHRGNLRAWLGSALRHRARSRGRAEQSRSERERVAARDEAHSLVEQATIQHEVVELVLGLGEPYRSVLLLRYFQELSVREIAAQQGLELNSVRSQLVRAHAQLRETLNRKYAGQGGRQTWAGLLMGGAGSVALKGSLGTTFLSLAAVALLIVGGGATWKALSGERPRLEPGDLRLGALDFSLDSEASLVALAGESLAKRSPSALAAKANDKEEQDTGSILLEVLDETTGEPLKDLAYIVYEEGDGKTLLAQGRTDERGRARVSGMPFQDVLIIRTERQPPHAAAYGAVWLTGKRPERARIEVGAGSSVHGHVQDEVGNPLAGIEVRADLRPQAGLNLKNASSFPSLESIGYAGEAESSLLFDANKQLLAVTDAEGNWRVEYLASMPQGVWVVEGKPRPGSWMPMSLTLRDPRWVFGRLGHKGFMLGKEDSMDLGTTTFLRQATLAGKVVDAQGNPIAGLLVFSSNDQVLDKIAKQGSYSAGDAFLTGNVTDEEGRFSVHDTPNIPRNTLLVWEPSGAFRSFKVAQFLTPGQIKSDLMLTLADKATLHLQLLNPKGDPIELSDDYGPRFHLGMKDGRRHQMAFVPRQNGNLTFLLDDPLSELKSIEVRIPFFYPRWIRFEHAGGSSQSLKLQLQPMPRLDIQMDLEFDKNVAFGLVQLHFRQGAPDGVSQKGPRIGRGARLHSIPLNESGTYWIEFSAAFGFEGSILRGPFETDQGPYELTITKEEWQAALSVRPTASKAASKTAPEHKTVPPEPNLAPQALAPGKDVLFSLRVVDSITGKPLPGARLILRMADANQGMGGISKPYYDATTETIMLRAFAGSFRFLVLNKGYKEVDIPGPIHAKAGERVDLGSIRLERLPEVRCMLLDGEGEPLPDLEVNWRMWFESGQGKTNALGQFQIQHPDNTQAPYLSQPDSSEKRDLAYFYTLLPDATTPPLFVYERSQKTRVTVDVHGYNEKEFFSYESLFMARGPETPGTLARNDGERLRLSSSPDGKLRRYSGHAAPGEYALVVQRFDGADLLVPITIAPGYEPQSFTVLVR